MKKVEQNLLQSKSKHNQLFFQRLLLALFLLFSITYVWGLFSPVSAECPPNVVPNIADPNCTGSITVGVIINRVLSVVPYGITILSVGLYGWSGIQLMLSQDEDKKKEAIQGLVRTTIGLVLFFSIWLVLFIISIVTGVDILASLGS